MKKDNYASKEETQALLIPDTRSPAEKALNRMLDERGAWEMGAEPYPVLYQIALNLLSKPVPDAFGTREGEHPQYIEGWNDCRAEMLSMRKRLKP
jgi:hypothetical protein